MMRIALLAALVATAALASAESPHAIHVDVDGVRYTCAAGGAPGAPGGGACAEIVAGARLLLETCERTDAGSSCAKRYARALREGAGGCALAVMPLCLERCQRAWSASTCAELCGLGP